MLTRRILALVALSMTPALLIQGYNEYALREARELAVRNLAMRSVRAVADDLAQYAEANRQLLNILSDEPVMRERDPARCSAFLQESAAKIPGSTIIALTDPEGKVACSSLGTGAIGYSIADREYFRTGMASGSYGIGEYLLGRGTRRPTVQFVHPLTDASGRRTGLTYMGVDPGWLGDRLKQTGLPPNATLTVTDRKGVVLVRLPDHGEWVGRPLPDRFLADVRALSGGVGEIPGLKGTLRIMAVLSPGDALSGLTVSVGLSRDTAFADIDAATLRGAVLILLGALLAFGGSLVAGRIFVRRPVERIVGVARAWRSGDLSARSGLVGPGEFGQIGEAFDAMAEALQRHEGDLRAELSHSRDLQQQQVTMLHELNHRVKNTLATVQSLARQSRGGEAQAEQLERRILALSKTHDLLTRDDWAGAPLREILENELGPYRGGPDHIVLDGPPVDLPPRYVLALGMTFHELSTNAAKYGALSAGGGRIRVRWRTEPVHAGGRRLHVDWVEEGGPPVAQPTRKGFGTRLITGGVARELGGAVDLRYEAEGLRCAIEVPLDAGFDAAGEPRKAWPPLRPVA
jgi:two-component sensor histidine kinase